ncbi:unnamed protein product [Rotaria socialis]|uniref:Uncharacterized protein n=1 Tax=Rotaria socialis TaxID=392032 RepID=A0A818BFR2_9BILA|nr:unnamed protein product [Rotaria socialis]CAF3419171.1 unnamed protein product [Rotaria socialis]CAF3780449.1 unnamed protein product [Rotaria socialis]
MIYLQNLFQILIFAFKLDESILNKDEAQTLYNQMRQLTKHYRTQAMSLFFERRKYNEIIDAEDDSGYLEFKHYNELHEKRYNLETEQSLYFLEAERAKGEFNEKEEGITYV